MSKWQNVITDWQAVEVGVCGGAVAEPWCCALGQHDFLLLHRAARVDQRYGRKHFHGSLFDNPLMCQTGAVCCNLSLINLQSPRNEFTSAVKRLKYLIAINRTFLSILNVPLFIYFFHPFIFTWMPLSTWKSWLACFMQMFYFIENQYCQTGRYKIKL